MNFKRLTYLVLTLSLFAGPVSGETTDSSLRCAGAARYLAGADSPDRIKYPADRDVQAVHLALDVTPDFKQRTIEGRAILRFRAVSKPVTEVKLDAVDLRVRTVTSSVAIQAWQVTADKLIITFAEPLSPNQEISVTIEYSAEPKEGIYFRTPEMGYKEGDTHLFSQGEESEARHWYPCLDSPNQLATSEITCRVPEGMSVISNGHLGDTNRSATTGLIAFHWVQDQAHANYLVSLVAGYFKKLEDNCHGIPLAFYTPPSEFAQAAGSFAGTKEMITFFEEDTGTAYAWDKYDQVCVNDFVAGGMENTSATTLTDSTLFTGATENIQSSEDLVSHELAHQWFGDLVTCKDWGHTWLNEGFATYYEVLWDGHHNGRDSMLYQLYQQAQHIIGIANDTTPIVRRDYDSSSEMFSYLVYSKAGWVVHMLRAELGDELYHRCIKTYLQRHRHGSVVTEDLRAVIEELSGRSYDQFFDQWLYHAHHPELDVAYSWDEQSRLAKITVRQTQEIGPKVLLFNVPLTVRFKGKFGEKENVVQIKKKEEDFYIPFSTAPELVRVDPHYSLLAKIHFQPPHSMLLAQLADKSDVIGRLLAIEQLAEKGDKDCVNQLSAVLRDDPFYGVRIRAAKGLRTIHSDEALVALIDSKKQSDARVRRQVAEEIGGFYSEKALAAATQILDSEKNPAILAAALRTAGGYAKPEVHAILLKYLNGASYRNELASAAISAIRSQDDPEWIAPLQQTLADREAEFTTHGFAQGLETLAFIARNEARKEGVREFLIARVNHKKDNVRAAVLRALGVLGDPRAIAVLEKFTGEIKENPERRAAEHSLTALRADRKPVDDFKNLRQEVLDLQKANRELRQELDDLKKKVEAGAPAQKGVNKAYGKDRAR